MMPDREKLKPCPFCGGKAHIMKMGYPHWIFCEECGAKIHGGVVGEAEGEKASAEAWNKRQPQIVWCKDCKYKQKSYVADRQWWCNRLEKHCDDDWFCADGEMITE